MKVLNLTNKETSDIKFEVSSFPDGQQNVIIPFDYKWLNLEQPFPTIVKIKSRLNNFKDLELIICATKSLGELGVKKIHLYTPYFMGARSDRKFTEGGNNYLKDVICPIINSLNFESVTVTDPHSHVLEACLNNFKSIDNEALVRWATDEIYNPTKNFRNEVVLVSPDAGASHKIYKLAEKISYKEDIITCTKERDTDGKLTKVNVPNLHRYDELRDYIIIDDICDGGNTFINIAKELKKNVKGKIYLIVTHGIFSKGIGPLSDLFDGIYTTNSYQDLEVYKGYLKQLNVF